MVSEVAVDLNGGSSESSSGGSMGMQPLLSLCIPLLPPPLLLLDFFGNKKYTEVRK